MVGGAEHAATRWVGLMIVCILQNSTALSLLVAALARIWNLLKVWTNLLGALLYSQSYLTTM